jgi:AsmA family protein
MNPTTRGVLRWTGVVAGAVLLVLIVILASIDWNRLKHPLERIASARSGRAVIIAGDLKVQIWSLTPEITLSGLTVGNPPWEPDQPMAKIERLYIKLKLLPLLRGDVILPRVEVIHPEIYLHRERSGRANWSFENEAPSNARAPKPIKLPAIQDFLIESGRLRLADDIRRLKVEGTVDARERGSHEDPHAFRIVGKGTLNNEPFAMQVAGGPLINLDPHKPYPFDLNISAGHMRVESNGTVARPFDLGELQLEVSASGRDLAELYYLTQVALPNTPPYKLHAHIERQGSRTRLSGIEGTLGSSDLSGQLDLDMSHKRPVLSGELSSRRLAMSDLAASVGGKSAAGIQPAPRGKGAKAAVPAAPKNPQDRLFPDARLQVERVRDMDANVRYRAQSVLSGAVPMKQVALDIKLDEGILSLDPFAFELQQGRLVGTARIDARPATPQVHLDVRMKDIQLEQFKGKAPEATAPFSGVMQARALIDGTGDSLHRVMASANGTFTAILPHGEVRSALAELTGINVVNGLALLLKGANDREPIRCGVAQFHIENGTMHAQSIVFDAQDVRITANGEIRLGPEELALSIRGHPKKLRFARVRAPIEVGGHIEDPKIGVNVGATAKQGAVAAALGAVMAPAVAVLAFVDPGLAKDENCAALLGNAEAGENAPLKGKTPAPPDNTSPPAHPPH